MKIRFLGATGTVTGSRTLVTLGARRLLVDCGMFQGLKQHRLRNREPLGAPPPEAVLLTHAHIDHSGWLPALVAQGFSGPVYCSEGTADLLGVLLPDAGRIQEEDAAYAARKGSSRHAPPTPLYTEEDAKRTLGLLRPQPFGVALDLGPLSASFRCAGHILGASSVHLESEATSLLFSGDLGRDDDAVVPAPASPPAVDHMVLESTYGDRLHPDVHLLDRLEEVILRTVERGGMLLIPSFAVGRAQALLWSLHQLMEAGRVPRLPVVVDSPMATRATDAFLRHAGDLRLTPTELQAMTQGVRFIGSAEESKSLNELTEPMVLISASGMLTGGRVLHHLSLRGPVKRNTLLFVGFQAPGTRGGRLLGGDRTMKIYGRKYKIRCDIDAIGGLSAHADAQGLVDWVAQAPRPPLRVLLNHGEPQAADALRIRLQEAGQRAEVAVESREYDLTKPLDAPTPVTAPRPLHELLRFAPALEFNDDSPQGVSDVSEALSARAAGLLPSELPLRVRSAGLAARLREALDDAQLDGLELP